MSNQSADFLSVTKRLVDDSRVERRASGHVSRLPLPTTKQRNYEIDLSGRNDFLFSSQLERGCRGELKRLMHIRTQSIDLMPEIEQNCIIDLAPCRKVDVKGEVRREE